MIPNQLETSEELAFTEDLINHLKHTSKWAKFLSIVGFISVGFLLILAVVVALLPQLNMDDYSHQYNEMYGSGISQSLKGPVLSLIYVAIAVLYFFPMLYLYQFSSNAIIAIRNRDNEKMLQSFKSIRKHYKFIGILTIVILAIYLIFLAAAFVYGFLSALS